MAYLSLVEEGCFPAQSVQRLVASVQAGEFRWTNEWLSIVPLYRRVPVIGRWQDAKLSPVAHQEDL
jgi:hypothetical protein